MLNESHLEKLLLKLFVLSKGRKKKPPRFRGGFTQERFG